MIIGIDMGASAVKIAALEGRNIALTHYEHGRGGNVPAICARLGLDLKSARAVAVTGLSAGMSGLAESGVVTVTVPEPEAIGRGAVWLSGRDNVVVASIGTGTAFVHAKGGVYNHLCGSGIGAGTLSGLAQRVLGVDDMHLFDSMALAGNTNHVDLTIGDFVEMHGDLTADITASNLARCNLDATREDWAAGLATLVYQAIGTMSLIACRGCGADGVVVTGGIAGTGAARENFKRFVDGYGIEYFVPEHSVFSTAIGAALYCGGEL